MSPIRTSSPARTLIALRTVVWLGFLVLIAGTLLAASARVWWLGEIACHFRWQLGLGALVGALPALLAGQRRLLAVILALALLHLAPGLRLYLVSDSLPAPAAVERTPIRLAVVNLLITNPRQAALREFLDAEGPDVVALLEVGADWRRAVEALDDYPYRAFAPASEADWHELTWGRAIVSRLPLETWRVVESPRRSSPVVEVVVRWEGRALTVRTVHPPRPGEGLQTALRDEVLGFMGRELSWSGDMVLLGDLNTSEYGASFRDLLAASGLRDSRLGFGRQPTFGARAPRSSGWPRVRLWVPIDHVLVGRSLGVVERRTVEFPGSDHRSVIAGLVWR